MGCWLVGLAKGKTFPYKDFCTKDPFPGTILINFGGEFFLGKIKGYNRTCDEREHRQAQYEFSQVSGLVGR